MGSQSPFKLPSLRSIPSPPALDLDGLLRMDTKVFAGRLLRAVRTHPHPPWLGMVQVYFGVVVEKADGKVPHHNTPPPGRPPPLAG